MSACKGCGKEIVWAETRAGKKIPLDPKPNVYRVVKNRDQIYGTLTTWAEPISGAMVTHFATCSKANDFSGSKKEVTL